MEYSTGKKKEKGSPSFLKLLFAGCLSLISFQIVYSQASDVRYLKYLAVEDLEYLREAIKNTHPAPFVYTTEAEFNQVVDAEISQLTDTVDYYTLRNAARRILYSVHCVHSSVLSRSISKKEALKLSDKFFPLEIRWVEDQLYVLKNYSTDTLIHPGDRILSINGYTPDSILQPIKQYRSGDGKNDHFMRGLINLPFQFNLLFDLNFPEDRRYIVRLLNSRGEMITDTLEAIYEPIAPPPPKDTTEYVFVNKRKNVKLRLLEHQVAYLKIEDFDGGMLPAFQHCFKLIEEKKSTDLIIDLRYNYGGGMLNANNLLSFLIDSAFSHSLKTPIRARSFDYYDEGGRLLRLGGMYYFFMINRGTFAIEKKYWLWDARFEPRKLHHFTGQIYVLINEHSLSAASYVASQLKHRTKAILVGTPTGGGEYGNGGYTYATFTLPNSRSKIKVPHNWVDYDIPTNVQQSLSPHHIIYTGIHDVLNNRDVVLEKTLEMIRNKSVKVQ